LPDEDISLKPKHAASNKTGINSVVVDGLYFPFTIPISDYCIFFIYCVYWGKTRFLWKI